MNDKPRPASSAVQQGPSSALPFGKRAVAAAQGEVLRAALAAVTPAQPVAAFDLDSTLLDNKQRQARIVREFGAAQGDERLAACPPAHVVSWDLRDTARLCGLDSAEVAAVHGDLRRFWLQRFFTSDYCADDVAIAGARDYLHAVLARGGSVLYVTGRHAGMREGTVESFRRAGFPIPGESGGVVDLWLKPAFEGNDDAWKEECHARLQATAHQRGLAAAFDNEPTHVNAYKRAFPAARVVHLDTDHSQRPVDVRDDIPSVRDFLLEPA